MDDEIQGLLEQADRDNRKADIYSIVAIVVSVFSFGCSVAAVVIRISTSK